LLGIQYTTSATKTASVFIQSVTTNLLNIDTLQVISTHSLPAEADVSAVNLGLTYDFNNTNYRYNPLRGNELQLIGTIGTKKIRRSDAIIKLTDPSDSGFSFNSLYDTVKLNSYEFRLKVAAAHYFQIGHVGMHLKQHANTCKYRFFRWIFLTMNMSTN